MTLTLSTHNKSLMCHGKSWSSNQCENRLINWLDEEPALSFRRVRSKIVRGYKSWQGLQASLMLAGFGVC